MTKPLICRLSNRGIIRIGGPDRHAFLQGLISNDINLCKLGQLIYAAFLTPQGKFLHDMFITESDGLFLVDCESVRADDLLKRLGTYKLRAKVTLEDARDTFDVWAMWGSDILQKSTCYADPRLTALGVRAIMKKGAQVDGQRVDFTVYDKHRLELGAPDGSRDMLVEKSTLLECNLDLLNAISWSKGCYIGQELTARMHYRALVKKRLFPVKITGPAPALGFAIQLNGAEVGEMRSSCEDMGLALLNIEAAQEAIQNNSLLAYDNAKLKVYKPTYFKPTLPEA